MSDRIRVRTPIRPLLYCAIFQSLFFTLACAPQSQLQEDSWSLTPPTLVATNSSATLSILKFDAIEKQYDKLGSAQSPTLSISAHIVFSAADLNLQFAFSSDCDGETYSGSGRTSDAVLIASLLPPAAVHRSLLQDNSAPMCSAKITVTSSGGSTHSFSLRQFKLKPLEEERKQQAQLEAQASHEARSRIRLLCGKWWVAESAMQANSSLSFERRMQALIQGPVEGLDDRDKNWNPECLMTFLDQEHREVYQGRIMPFQSKKRLTVAEHFDWQFERAVLSAQGPFARWTLTNQSRYPMVLRVPTPPTKMRLRAARHDQTMSEFSRHWQRSSVLDINVQVDGPSPTQSKKYGHVSYYFLQPNESLKVLLNIASQASCTLSAPSTLFAQLEQALLTESLDSAISLNEFLGMDQARLDASTSSNRSTLLHTAYWSIQKDRTKIARISSASAQSYSDTKPSHPTCQGGSLFGGVQNLPE